MNDASDSGRPIALLNPELVDMGTTGYGMAGRMFKERLLDTLVPCYYLRTLDWGALARTYPKPYSVSRGATKGREMRVGIPSVIISRQGLERWMRFS